MQINSVNSWYKPWFFNHVRSFLDKPGQHIEYIPMRDYYHRHQRAYFWEINVVMPFGDSFLFRYLFGWVYPVNFQLMKLFTYEWMSDLFFTRNHVLQDFMVPMSKFEATVSMVHQEVEVCVRHAYVRIRICAYMCVYMLKMEIECNHRSGE
jgi:delta24-sterol reductase